MRSTIRASGCMVVSALVLGSISLSALASAHAQNASPYNQPRWWAKYLVVSSPGVKPGTRTQRSGSISVGTNVDASNEAGPQSETSIAINPNKSSQIVAGSNEIDRLPMRAYFSSNGGKSFTGVDLPLPPPVSKNGFDFGSDPGVAWDTSGNVYYSYIVVFFGAGGGINGTEMAVARSSDGGQTWTATYFNFQSGEGQFNDKPMIAVDSHPGSPHVNTIYVAWDNSNGNASNSNATLVSHSTDGGMTFSTPVYASPTNAGPASVIGADPFVGPDGTLYVAWHDIENNDIAESSSTDGGQSFGPVRVIAPTQVSYDIAIPAMNTRHALVYPACNADATGTLYCSWMDETAGNGTDIFVSRSTDGGLSWSAPLRVNDDPTGVANDQFNQWLAVDPNTGSINVSWNDTRNDPTHISSDVYYAQSSNGALSFGPNVKVTTATTNETCCGADLGNQYGDYEGIAALSGSVHPIWTDRRDSVAALDEEVFTATITTK